MEATVKQPIPYVPRYRLAPRQLLDVPSAWKGIESILPCLLDDFKVVRGMAVEFGTEYGYSLTALSNYFKGVIGVDTFTGLGHDEEFYGEVQRSMGHIGNAVLIQGRWQDVYKTLVHGKIDLIHIDIDHSYVEDYELGEWAVQQCPFVIAHDTMSYGEIPGSAGIKACGDLAEKYGLHFYNFEESHGLGILSRRPL